VGEIDAKSTGFGTKLSEHLSGARAYDEGFAGEHKRLEMPRGKSPNVVRRKDALSVR